MGDIVSPHLAPVPLRSGVEAQAYMQTPAFSFMLNDPYLSHREHDMTLSGTDNIFITNRRHQRTSLPEISVQ